MLAGLEDERLFKDCRPLGASHGEITRDSSTTTDRGRCALRKSVYPALWCIRVRNRGLSNDGRDVKPMRRRYYSPKAQTKIDLRVRLAIRARNGALGL